VNSFYVEGMTQSVTLYYNRDCGWIRQGSSNETVENGDVLVRRISYPHATKKLRIVWVVSLSHLLIQDDDSIKCVPQVVAMLPFSVIDVQSGSRNARKL